MNRGKIDNWKLAQLNDSKESENMSINDVAFYDILANPEYRRKFNYNLGSGSEVDKPSTTVLSYLNQPYYRM